MWKIAIVLMLLLTSFNSVGQIAICDGTVGSRDDLKVGLLTISDLQFQQTGAGLILQLDVICR